ncbi:MAG: DUF4129 domain-containing protein [Candidatus Promineifilaceae bacterium]|jgi:hypothetical protein
MTKLHMTSLARIDEQIDQEQLKSLRRRYLSGRPMRYVFRPFLMSVMLAALMIGLLAVIVEVSGDSRWFRATFLLFFIALESIYTTNWLNHPQQLPLDRSTYRAAELLLLLILVFIASWLIFDQGIPTKDMLFEYLRAPQTLILNGHFLITALLAAIIWRLATQLSEIFTKLQVSEFELRFHSLPLAQRKERAEDQPIQFGRGELVDAFVRSWLLGGLLLVFAIGFSTIDQQSVEKLTAPLASGRASLEPRLLSALLLYFIIGLWLLSQARLMNIHARWLLNNVNADENARQKWQRTSLLILALVVLIAAFLPIGSTSAISQIINVVLFWGMAIAYLIIFLLILPFAMLLALFSGQGIEEVTPPPTLEPTFMQPPLESGSSYFGETIAMVLSSGFWSVLIIVVLLALLFYFRERRLAGRGLIKDQQLIERFINWLKEVWANLRKQARSLQDTLILMRETESSGEENPGERSRWRFLRVSSLSPRDQLRYFYLSTVRRAGDQGVKREPSGTPNEYVDNLKQSWPEVEEEFDDLTKAFLKARYSSREISAEDIPPVKGTWKEVRRELNQKPTSVEEPMEGSEE